MRYRFYINPETNQPHVLDHSVFEQEVIEAFENGFEDRHAVNKARSRIGQTYAGRYLRIIYRVFPGELFIITAYDLTGKPLKAFRRRQK